MGGHVTDLISAYLDNELNEADQNRVLQHLEWCGDCQKEEQSLKQIKEWVSGIYEMEPVPNFIDQHIMDEIKQMERISRKLEYGLGAVAISILVLFSLIHSFFNHSWKVLYAFYRVGYSFVRALPELVGLPAGVTVSVLGAGLLIVVITFPLFRKLLHSIAVEDRRGWQ